MDYGTMNECSNSTSNWIANNKWIQISKHKPLHGKLKYMVWQKFLQKTKFNYEHFTKDESFNQIFVAQTSNFMCFSYNKWKMFINNKRSFNNFYLSMLH